MSWGPCACGSTAAFDQLGLWAAVAGTHPTATWSEIEVSDEARYHEIHASMRVLAEREPTLALHVHVAVPRPSQAIAALNGLRHDVPLLLALAANSPYWQGRDTGLASARIPLFSMFPRVGIPRRFGNYGDYVGVLNALIRGGAIPDPSFVWWDVRLRPHLGTVEVRVMDDQTRVQDSAALVQCLVVLHAEGELPPEPLGPEALAENRFLASRDGLQAAFITSGGNGRRPAVHRLAELVGRCRGVASSLGCSEELDALNALAEDPGYVRQRRAVNEHGIDAALARMASEFAGAPVESAVAG